MTMSKTFGQALRDLRRSKGLSQRELASRVSVDFSYISKLENDRIPPPATNTIIQICEVLEAPPDELLALSGKMPRDLQAMLSSNTAAMEFIRTAKNLGLTSAEWDELTRNIKRLRGAE